MERGPICLMLFRFGKWQGSGNSKNATALRQFINADEDLMFLTKHQLGAAMARPGARRRRGNGAVRATFVICGALAGLLWYWLIGLWTRRAARR